LIVIDGGKETGIDKDFRDWGLVPDLVKWNKAYHEWGMQQPRFNEQNMLHISTAVELMEKQRHHRSRYNIERNGPFLLLDLAMAYYSNRIFSETIELFKGIRVEYPEITPMIYTIQRINLVWPSLSTIPNIIHPAWINVEFGLSYSECRLDFTKEVEGCEIKTKKEKHCE